MCLPLVVTRHHSDMVVVLPFLTLTLKWRWCYHFFWGVSLMRAPRKDLVRNRQRLVTAARKAFIEHGPEVSLEEIARRAGVGPTTLYRHFPDKDDLIEAVLDDLIQAVQDNADQATHIEDPYEAFRAVFTRSSDVSEREVATFLRLAGVSRRTDEHADRLITAVIGPATSRLREVGGVRADITVDDIVMFVRMTVAADNEESRAKAIDILLAGVIRPVEQHDGHGVRT
jgi:AcrR family transcriptional regulator